MRERWMVEVKISLILNGRIDASGIEGLCCNNSVGWQGRVARL